MAHGPALRGSELRARAERRGGPAAIEPKSIEQGASLALVYAQLESRKRQAQRLPARQAQRSIALRHLWQALFVELAGIVEYPVPQLADVAGAHGNSGEERDESGLECPWKDDGLVVTFRGEAAPQAAAFSQLQ